MSTETIETAPQKKLRFDDASLQENAAKYKDKRAFEPTVWLGRYARTDCACNLRVLGEKIRALKIPDCSGSYETLHKILTGKAFSTEKSEAGGSVNNLIVMVDALKKRKRLEEMAGKVSHVNTGTWRKIENYIDLKSASERVCKFGVIVGHTGQQKTASFKQYCLLNNNVTSDRSGPINPLAAPDVIHCVHMEAPFRPSMPQFTEELALRYGVDRTNAKRSGMAVIHKQVGCNSRIIIDNIQRLYKVGIGKVESISQPIFNFLQKLQDDTDCTIILSLTPDFLETLTSKMNAGYFEQFEGRAGGRENFLVLPDYMLCEGEQRTKLLQEDIIPIANSFGMLHAERHGDFLEKLVRRPGRIRILFNALQNARQFANAKNTELTIDVLEESLGLKKGVI